MPFFEKTFECKICDHTFKELRIRKSRQRVSKVDKDFAMHCIGPNPVHYIVSVCPSCGFSFTPGFTYLPKDDLQQLKLLLVPSKEDFSGERTHNLAVLSFQRAIWCANLKKEKENTKAGLYLHLAWTHRFAGEEKEEKINLMNALYHYIKVYEVEEITEEAKVMYLIGELHRRLGNDNEAIRWFSEMIGRHKKQSPQLAKMARERWQFIRELAYENQN